MIIPPRCFTCGKVLADKWDAFSRLVDERKKSRRQQQQQKEREETLGGGESIDGIDSQKGKKGTRREEYDEDDTSHDVVNIDKKEPKGEILDELGITRMCCRCVMLTHVDLIDDI